MLSAALATGVLATGCTKKTDETATTEFNAKKASAQTLVGEISTAMAKMSSEHQQWMTDLNAAAAKKNADTSRAASLRDELKRHEDNAAHVSALVDSVKLYSNDKPDDVKTQNDRLSSNFDDLNSSWKQLLDEHARLQGDITSYAAMASGDATLPDSLKNTSGGGIGQAINNAGTKVRDAVSGDKHETTKKSTGGATKNPTNPTTPSTDKHETTKHSTGGATKNPTNAPGTSTNNTQMSTDKHETSKHSTGGATKNPTN